jgi:putative acetyltransferase
VQDLEIRAEQEADRAAIARLNREAFGRPDEADLVDALRAVAKPYLSLVACRGGGPVVGHILFTPVFVEGGDPSGSWLGLAPMAVTPALQRAGIGSALVRSGVQACRASGAEVVVVLGHPGFYPRFGFEPARARGLLYQSEEFAPAFFVQELRPGALASQRGRVRYLPPFDAV